MKTRRYRLRNRLVLMTTLLCVVALAVAGVALIAVQTQRARENTRQGIDVAMQSANTSLNGYMSYLSGIIRSIRHNATLLSALRGEDVTNEVLGGQLEYCADLYADQNLSSESVPFLSRLVLFSNSDKLWSTRYYPLTQTAIVREDAAMRERIAAFRQSGEEMRWELNGDEPALLTLLYDDNFTMIACAAFVIDTAVIDDVYGALEQYEGTLFGLCKKGQNVLYGSFEREADLSGLMQDGRLGGETYLTHTQEMPFGVYAVAAVPASQIDWLIRPTIRSLLLIVLLILPFVSLFASLMVYSMTRPLKTVTEKIRQVAAGDFRTRLEPFSSAEFYEVGQTFNAMTEKIHHLVTEVYENQLLAKDAELKFLQSQINPHFMFNVLSMIGMTAMQNGDNESYRMIHSFSKLIQGKIFRDQQLCVPLHEEIALVDYYLFLQCKRYEGKITYAIRCDDERLYALQVPKLCIEPIAENAFLHGVAPKQTGGRVDVEITSEGDTLIVRVKDNGVGFQIVPDDKEHPHMGLINTRRLIQNLYGSEYGIDIQSEVDHGTTVTITLPMKGDRADEVEGASGR